MEKILKKFKRKSPKKQVKGITECSIVHSQAQIKRDNFVLKVLLDGVYDEESHLSKLRGQHHILKCIWTNVKSYWQSHIILPGPVTDRRGLRVISSPASLNSKTHPTETPVVTFAAPMGHIDNYDHDSSYNYKPMPKIPYPEFPDPSGININMMPFICGRTFEDCKLPEFLRPYSKLIEMCLRHHHSREHPASQGYCEGGSDLGKVYYLTIQESEVESGQCQRRPGLHVDSPGWVKIKNNDVAKVGKKGSGSSRKYTDHHWGAGSCHVFHLGTNAKKYIGDIEIGNINFRDICEDNLYVTAGGIYIASNVPDSARVWNCAVDGEVIGQHGDIEHLRSALGEGEVMRPGQARRTRRRDKPTLTLSFSCPYLGMPCLIYKKREVW